MDQEHKKVSAAAKDSGLPLESESRRGAVAETSVSGQAQLRHTNQPKSGQPPPPKLIVTLKRTGNDAWTLNQTVPNPAPEVSNVIPLLNLPTSSVAENVTSFLSGIRATFRSDNKNVMPKQQQLKINRISDTTQKSYD